MTHPRSCAYNGHLVDGATRLSVDPCEYNDLAVRALVGCCQLKCSRCGAFVRGGPPGLELKPGMRVDFALLQSAPSWAELPFLQPRLVVWGWERRVRLYACKCLCWDIELTEGLEVDHEFPDSPAGTWACAGHPLPELPLQLGGLEIGATTDWPSVVSRILDGTRPRELELAPAEREGPSIWLGWLYNYLRGLGAAEQLSAAIAERITDPEPVVVGRVLFFFMRFPGASGVERLIARAEEDVSRVAIGYPIPEFDKVPSLWSVLVEKQGIDELIRRVLVLPLFSLSHEQVGQTDLVECERELRSRVGWDKHPNLMRSWLEDFARARKAERLDVVATALQSSAGAFHDPSMRRFLAEHVVEIDAAGKGRWRQVMHLLSEWRTVPGRAELLVAAGSRIFEAGLASAEELRAWIQQRRSYGWVQDEWVRPLEAVLQRGRTTT